MCEIETYENSIECLIKHQLPDIDNALAENQVPLSERPFTAAYSFVDYCIVAIKGDSKDKFLEKEWFKYIYNIIKQWYSNRYSGALYQNERKYAVGIVLIYNTPFQLKVPFSVNQEQIDNYKMWSCIPNSILDSEDIIGWIKNKPNIDNMSKDNFEKLKKDINNIAINIRSTHVNLMSASLKNNLREKANTIQVHMDKAADDILSLDVGRRGVAYWEVHLAIEKTLKLIILQNCCDHKNEHKLDVLCRIINNTVGLTLNYNIFSKFLSVQEIMKQRYGEGNSYTVQEATNNFIIGNEVISKLTILLKRKLIFDNIELLTSIPPWER